MASLAGVWASGLPLAVKLAVSSFALALSMLEMFSHRFVCSAVRETWALSCSQTLTDPESIGVFSASFDAVSTTFPMFQAPRHLSHESHLWSLLPAAEEAGELWPLLWTRWPHLLPPDWLGARQRSAYFNSFHRRCDEFTWNVNFHY